MTIQMRMFFRSWVYADSDGDGKGDPKIRFSVVEQMSKNVTMAGLR